MKITHRDLKQGLVKVKIDDAEDKWYLEPVIEPGDLVSGMTERKIKIGGADEKSKISRRMVFLKIKVEKIEVDSTLRVTGTIVDAPDDIPRGDYHTFDIDIGTVISIEKSHWPRYMLGKIEDAVNKQTSPILLVAFDREDAIFAMLKSSGYEKLVEMSGDVVKKDNVETKKGSFYKEIITNIEEYDRKYAPTNIILASPAFWKEYLLKELNNDAIRKKIVLATCSAIDGSTINEVLKRPELKAVLEKDKSTRELKIVEELLLNISNNLASYGAKDVAAKLESGNVAVLIVSEALIRKSRGTKTFNDIEQMIRKAEGLTAEIRIISSLDAQKKLDGITGIACVFRWKENY